MDYPINSRFFPDGQVLSLLANEELGPQQVIPLLKPTLRMKVRHLYLLFRTAIKLSSIRVYSSESGN